jgi:sarcosine oxidase subunit alpha
MTQPFRTATGGRVDRNRVLHFSFDGRPYRGFAGDTLASALLANDVHLVARSFKYHRPRGIVAAGSEEPNALVTIDRGAGDRGAGRITPNLRATQVELYDGLTALSQNRYPSLRFDLGAMAGLAAPLLSAGFYYKSFMWPQAFWRRLYEPAIRRSAGLGRAPGRADPDRYLHQYAHCEVLIIGGGPAGLAAALGAAASGARVILCDEQAELGGSLLHEPGVTIDGWPAPDWVREAITTLSGSVTLLPRTTAFGWYPGNMIGLVERVTDHLAAPAATLPRERLWQVRAGRVVLATGAIERPLVFPGNDRPGIMLAEAARTCLHRYGVKVGRRVMVATADDSAYRAAIDLHAAGVTIAAIVDQRPKPESETVAVARSLGIPIHTGMTIGSTEGRRRVHSARLADRTAIIPCDTILMSGGWTPTVHLFSQSRGKLVFDPGSGTYLPSEGAAGACAGRFDLQACLRDGTAAGGSEPRSFAVTGMPAMAPPQPPIAPPTHRKAFVDFQNDVTTKDLATATNEGFVSVEHVKRYTTTGMATDQGKTSNLNALTAVAALTQQVVETVGQTTYRPPYTPVTFGALAGASRGSLFQPIRLPPIATPGGVLEDVGTWKRARCFPAAGETIDDAVARECLAVRNDVGMLDASTLGKIEVVGPDAASFLSRIYTGNFTDLPAGRCRYAILLGEDGFIRDDGIVARLAVDRFHVTTTTGGAAFVLHHMEDYLQTEFTGLRVWLTSVTEQWAVIAVQGPKSAAVLAAFIPDIDLGAMPHMSVREGHIGEVPIRLFRISFTGEAGFEVNLPPNQAQRVWNTLLDRGVTPYGTDAMHILRAEKGYIIVGQETDGTVTPDDVGLGWTIGTGDFVGKRSLSLPDLKPPGRRQLVGLLPADPAVVPEEGAQVIASPGPRPNVSSPVHGAAALSVGNKLTPTAGNDPLSSPSHAPPSSPGQGATPSPGLTGGLPGRSSPETTRRSATPATDKKGRSSPGTASQSDRPEISQTGRISEYAGPVGHVTSAYGSAPLRHGFALALVADGRFRLGSTLFVPTRGGTTPVKVTGPVFLDQSRARLHTRSGPRPPSQQLLPAVDQPAPVARPSGLVQLTILAPTSRLSVRAGYAAGTGIGLTLGVLLPTVPCRSVISRDRAALWLGPDEWLIIAPESTSGLAAQARKAAGEHPASIIDVSHGSRTVEVSGHRAAWCLNAFCALDLDLQAFPVGMCTRTLLGKAQVVLWRIAPEVFQLDVAPSYMPYVWACLEQARLEFTETAPVPTS